MISQMERKYLENKNKGQQVYLEMWKKWGEKRHALSRWQRPDLRKRKNTKKAAMEGEGIRSIGYRKW